MCRIDGLHMAQRRVIHCFQLQSGAEPIDHHQHGLNHLQTERNTQQTATEHKPTFGEPFWSDALLNAIPLNPDSFGVAIEFLEM